MIGPDGSRKSIDKAEVIFEGKETSKYNISEIPRFDLLRTFQETKINSKMTCLKISKLAIRNPGDSYEFFFKNL